MRRVSVVTVFYNRAALVRASIGSLLAQTYPDLEIIAVDDGSADGTGRELAALSDPRLKVISHSNRGFTASLNLGIRQSSGDYVAIHGAGDISDSRRIEEQATVLDAKPNVGVVGCYVHDATTGILVKSPSGLPFFDTQIRRGLFTHGEVMFRRTLFDLVGGYREFFHFAQDRDLWLRMSEHCDYEIIPKVLYSRTHMADSLRSSADKQIAQVFFSELAVQSAVHRRKHGFDLIDRYGSGSMVFRCRSPKLARRLAGLGIRRMLEGDRDGLRMVRIALREYPSPRVVAVYLGCSLLSTPLSPVVRSPLAAFYKGRQE